MVVEVEVDRQVLIMLVLVKEAPVVVLMVAHLVEMLHLLITEFLILVAVPVVVELKVVFVDGQVVLAAPE